MAQVKLPKQKDFDCLGFH